MSVCTYFDYDTLMVHQKQSDERLSLALLPSLSFVATVRSEALVAIYGSVTSITVALMVNSMVQCNMILAAILKNGKTYVSEAEEEEFMFRCRVYAFYYMPGSRPPYPRRTFQRMWERRFEANWRIAFRMFSIGVPFFLITLGCSHTVLLVRTHMCACTSVCVLPALPQCDS